MRSKAWMLSLYAIIVFFLSVLHYSGLVWRGIMIAVIGLTGVIAVLLGVYLHRPSARLPWICLAAAIALFATGDATYSILTDLLHHDNPYPSLADVFYLATYPVLFLGMSILVMYRNRQNDWGSFLDALTLTTAIGFLVWVYLVEPYANKTNVSFANIVSIAYPLADVLLWSLLVRLLMTGPTHRAIQLLALGAAGLFVSDILYALNQINGYWKLGSPIDLGWIIFYFAWGAAALHPAMTSLTQASTQRPRARIHPMRLTLLATASLTAPIVLLAQIEIFGSAHNAGGVAIISGVMFLLVALRMMTLSQAIGRRDRESYFRALVQNASDLILIINEDNGIKYASPSTLRVLGRTVGRNEPFLNLVHPDDAECARRFLVSLRNQATPNDRNEWRIGHEGAWVETEARGDNLRHDPAIGGLVLTLRDVTQQHLLERELVFKAFHDSLTGLANRVLFRDRLEHSLSWAERDGRLVGVVFIDLDDFKIINDTLGHPVGDELLTAVAARIASSLRAIDTAARLGGDEFAVLIENCQQVDHIETLVDKLSQKFREPFELSSGTVSVKASIGFSNSFDSHIPDELLRFADLALYEAKALGKGQWCAYREPLQAAMRERHKLREDINQALEKNEFHICFQPIVDLWSAEVMGFEALLRWEHPERGSVTPACFITAAEETGLIITLGAWVLEKSIQQAAHWRAQGKALPYITVNVSPKQFQHPDFGNIVKKLLDQYNLPGNALVLELTESVLMQHDEHIRKVMRDLRESLGIRIAIDDFGTGYSSLSYLLRFPMDILKIDRSFVNGMTHSKQQLALVESIIQLSGALDLKVVAEGVETAEQCSMLKRTGCLLGQGFLFSDALGQAKKGVSTHEFVLETAT